MISFSATDNHPPASSYATLDTRNSHPVLDFDAASDESAIFAGVLPRNYGGNGLKVVIAWAATSASSGDVVWNAAFERINDESLDIDSDSFDSAQAATGTAAGTNGQVQYTEITFASNQIDGLAVGEAFRLKITRDADNGSDTMTGDAELLRIEVREA